MPESIPTPGEQIFSPAVDPGPLRPQGRDPRTDLGTVRNAVACPDVALTVRLHVMGCFGPASVLSYGLYRPSGRNMPVSRLYGVAGRR